MRSAAELTPTEFDDVRLQRRFKDSQGLPDTDGDITVGDMRQLMEQGLNTKAIRRLYPGIKPRVIVLAHAFIIASDPHAYNRIKKSVPRTNSSVVVDECISARALPSVRKHIGNVYHVSHLGLTGMGKSRPDGDTPLWRYVVNENLDAVVTLDTTARDPSCDLGAIAMHMAKDQMARMDMARKEIIDLADLPIVIGFKIRAEGDRTLKVMDALKRNASKIRSYLETRTSPFIIVTKSGVRPEKTYTELYAEMMDDTGRDGKEIISRRDRRIEQWTNRILSGADKSQLSKSRLRRIDSIVRAAAAMCDPLHDNESGPALEADENQFVI